jgi:hypothetical protein
MSIVIWALINRRSAPKRELRRSMASSADCESSTLRRPFSVVRVLRFAVLAVCVIYILPLVAHTLILLPTEHRDRFDDLSRSGVIRVETSPGPRILVLSARLLGRSGFVATHSSIAVKRADSDVWTRFEVLPWSGDKPIIDNWSAGVRWLGNAPIIIADVGGPKAAALIPKIEAASDAYEATVGKYHWWPGPNSNTFVAYVLRDIPELQGVLPPTAIGKDYRPHFYVGLTDSRTGFEFSFWGILGLKIGWIEGLEVNLFGIVAGLDVRRPALKVPGFGRVGMPAAIPAQ